MKKSTLQNKAYDYIKDKIICCEYKPGAMLNEELLCDTLKISRTPIREAIGKLEQDGLLVVKPKKGILVKPISIEDVNNVFELRILYETYAIKTYGCTLSPDVLYSYYQKISNEVPTDSDRSAFFKEDDDLHFLFVSAVRNRFILESYETITVQNNRFRYMTGFFNDRRIEETRDEHLVVLKYAIENNWVKAAEAMESHLLSSKSVAFSYLLSSDSLSTGICSSVL